MITLETILVKDREGKIMKDIIDERNEKERISRSIIKYWNVNYVATPPQQEVASETEAEQMQAGGAELDSEMSAEELYNATTGAYSGRYGNIEIEDEVTKGQIDKILHEKTEALRDLIESADGEMAAPFENAESDMSETLESVDDGLREALESVDDGLREALEGVDDGLREALESVDDGLREALENADGNMLEE